MEGKSSGPMEIWRWFVTAGGVEVSGGQRHGLHGASVAAEPKDASEGMMKRSPVSMWASL